MSKHWSCQLYCREDVLLVCAQGQLRKTFCHRLCGIEDMQRAVCNKSVCFEQVMDGLNDVLHAWLTTEEYVKATEQHRLYRSGLGIWLRKGTLELARSLSAHAFWMQCGGGAPELQKVALKVHSQPTVASSCERNWSTYTFIHSVSRNRLLPDRAEKLVSVHSNVRLMRKLTAVDYADSFPSWPDSDSEGSEDDEGDDDVGQWASKV